MILPDFLETVEVSWAGSQLILSQTVAKFGGPEGFVFKTGQFPALGCAWNDLTQAGELLHGY